jgi:hypothetical protein
MVVGLRTHRQERPMAPREASPHVGVGPALASTANLRLPWTEVALGAQHRRLLGHCLGGCTFVWGRMQGDRGVRQHLPVP